MRPQKKGMSVNGKRMDLEHYLLDVIDRPLPPAPTHYVVAEILNTDLSVKRVSIYFNPCDTWRVNSSFENSSPEGVGTAISKGLSFLNADPNTLAYKFWIVEVTTNQVIHKGWTYSLNKCEI